MLMLDTPQLFAPAEAPEKANIQSQISGSGKVEGNSKKLGVRGRGEEKKNPIKLHEEQMRSQDKPVLRAPKTAISP